MNVFAAVIGIVLIVIGILTACGNLSLLHAYHVRRVKEEDKKPFGRLMGIGNIIVGIGVVVSAFLSEGAANVVLIPFLVLGLGLSFFALFKYNKGIF